MANHANYPNPPGHPDAVKEGCLCPVMDNGYGKGVKIDGEVLYWRNAKCPLHGTAPDLSKCPNCGGEADNGHDRSYPPVAYFCSKCMAAEC
jgi:hypothetical protein